MPTHKPGTARDAKRRLSLSLQQRIVGLATENCGSSCELASSFVGYPAILPSQGGGGRRSWDQPISQRKVRFEIGSRARRGKVVTGLGMYQSVKERNGALLCYG
jgi:hypothetical protein